jgi:hypothetical protein
MAVPDWRHCEWSDIRRVIADGAVVQPVRGQRSAFVARQVRGSAVVRVGARHCLVVQQGEGGADAGAARRDEELGRGVDDEAPDRLLLHHAAAQPRVMLGDEGAQHRDGQRQRMPAPGLADVVVNPGKGEAAAAGFDRVERTASREVVRDANAVRDEPEDGDRGSGGPVSVHW